MIGRLLRRWRFLPPADPNWVSPNRIERKRGYQPVTDREPPTRPPAKPPAPHGGVHVVPGMPMPVARSSAPATPPPPHTICEHCGCPRLWPGQQ